MQLTNSNDFRLAVGLLSSTIFHIVMALVLIGLNNYSPLINTEVKNTQNQRFELEDIGPSQLRKIRQAGVRGGNKNEFSAPIKNSGQASQREETSKEQRDSSKISLNDLSATLNSRPTQSQTKNTSSEESGRESAISLKRLQASKERIARQQQVIQQDVLNEIGRSARGQEVIKKTGFNLQFEPPEGIPEDELNSVEKIFYSFQRRTFTSYVNTFIGHYHTLSNRSSSLKRSLQTESHDLTGRVEFNQKGEVTSIRIIKSSPRQAVHDLFEMTLKDLKLPNPPRDLLREDGRLVIYYRLKIND